jgi:uncharacterized Fe-S radical SAM superfamily protein PflX
MDQYRPSGKIDAFAELEETISAEEYQQAIERAEAYGLTRLDRRNLADLVRHLFDKG